MSMSPFDIKTALMAKHAQHVVLIHFPIALFTAAVACDFLGQLVKSRTLAATVYLNLLIAAVFTLPVVATGLAAWQWALEGKKLKGVLLMHLVSGGISSVLICIVFWIHLQAQRRPEHGLPKYRLPLEAIALLLVGWTAHLGGFLSGVNGQG
jgi:uncharacterized membrane protein